MSVTTRLHHCDDSDEDEGPPPLCMDSDNSSDERDDAPPPLCMDSDSLDDDCDDAPPPMCEDSDNSDNDSDSSAMAKVVKPLNNFAATTS